MFTCYRRWLEQHSQRRPAFSRSPVSRKVGAGGGIDSSGGKIGGDLKLTIGMRDPSPSLVWNGSEYAAAWDDFQAGSEAIYFARLGCDCVDVDGDGASPTCASDCDDTDAAVNPVAEEICNGVDEDCGNCILTPIPARRSRACEFNRG